MKFRFPKTKDDLNGIIETITYMYNNNRCPDCRASHIEVEVRDLVCQAFEKEVLDLTDPRD